MNEKYINSELLKQIQELKLMDDTFMTAFLMVKMS